MNENLKILFNDPPYFPFYNAKTTPSIPLLVTHRKLFGLLPMVAMYSHRLGTEVQANNQASPLCGHLTNRGQPYCIVGPRQTESLSGRYGSQSAITTHSFLLPKVIGRSRLSILLDAGHCR